MDLNSSGTRMVFSGTLLKLVTVNLEDGKILDEHPEETMLFDVKFDQSDNIWYVCNDMEFKRYNYHTKKETFSHKDEKGSADTVKEINNMIQIDETRGHVYCRVGNTKIVEFTCASNSMVDEFDNLTEEKDSSGQDMFIYFFKVAQRRIFYSESRRQHVKLYDMDSKQVICKFLQRFPTFFFAILPGEGWLPARAANSDPKNEILARRIWPKFPAAKIIEFLLQQNEPENIFSFFLFEILTKKF
jgi:hypothetical protein